MWINIPFVFLLTQCSYCAEDNLNLNRALFLPACYRNDPDFNDCLLRSTDLLRPSLKKGIPELDLPPISPFFTPHLRFEQAGSNASYIFIVRNVTLTGLDTYKFTSFKLDLEKLQLVASFNVNFINFNGNYSVNGQFLGTPIEGDGSFNLNITDSSGTIKQLLGLTVRDGVTYIEPLFDLTKVNLGRFSYEYDGLHEDNAVLKRNADRVIYTYEPYWTEYYKTVIEKQVVGIITDVLLKNIYRVPFEKLFPRH